MAAFYLGNNKRLEVEGLGTGENAGGIGPGREGEAESSEKGAGDIRGEQGRIVTNGILTADGPPAKAGGPDEEEIVLKIIRG